MTNLIEIHFILSKCLCERVILILQLSFISPDLTIVFKMFLFKHLFCREIVLSFFRPKIYEDAISNKICSDSFCSKRGLQFFQEFVREHHNFFHAVLHVNLTRFSFFTCSMSYFYFSAMK